MLKRAQNQVLFIYCCEQYLNFGACYGVWVIQFYEDINLNPCLSCVKLFVLVMDKECTEIFGEDYHGKLHDGK